MHDDGQPAMNRSVKFLRGLLPASLIIMVLLSGCDADTRDEQAVGSGISRPYSSPAEKADTAEVVDEVVDETGTISTASSIEINNGNLSVSLDAMPLYQVMAEISHQSGVEIRFIGEHPESIVDMQFSDSLLEPGLRRLLGKTNSVFLYSDTGPETSQYTSQYTGAVENHGRQLATVLILPKGENSNLNDETINAVDTLAALSEQIQNSIQLSGTSEQIQHSIPLSGTSEQIQHSIPLSGISEQILNSIPLFSQPVNTSPAINDTLSDQSLDELVKTLRERISNLDGGSN